MAAKWEPNWQLLAADKQPAHLELWGLVALRNGAPLFAPTSPSGQLNGAPDASGRARLVPSKGPAKLAAKDHKQMDQNWTHF